VHDVDLFDRPRVEEMLRQLEAVLEQAVALPEAPIGSFSLVTREAAALLPDPAASLPNDWYGAVHHGLTRSAARDPHRLALVGEDERWTYGELEVRSNQVARSLLASGVSRGDVVALWAHRCPSLVCAVQGTLKAGAAMMILDPAYPAPRLADYLAIGRPKAWLAVEGAPEPPEEARQALPTIQVSPDARSFAVTDPGVPVGPDDAACLTFTSGSTGRPKAVVGLHGSLSHFLPFLERQFALSAADRFGMLSALAHDPFQRDVFTPLWLGAALYVPDSERIASPGYLAEWVRRTGITLLNLTPAMMEVLILAAEVLGEEMPSLTRAFVVGDALKRSDVDRLRRWAPRLVCANLYGATETQRALAFFDAPPSGLGREVVPLGRGMDGTQLLILTPAGDLAGVGELGEIHLRGPHLARGYLDDPALTAERFLPEPSGRRYKTGDLGRYLPDGNAEIVGRADHQVKLRGFRIELGEVEAALARHPGVEECVVLVREDRPGDRRLVAWVVGEEAPDLEALRVFLAASLPDYMVPQAVVKLAALPITPAGKIDRLSLPAPETDGDEYVAPRNEVEAVLAAVWAEVLGVERVGVCDNFFGLGGDSILAIQLVSRLRRRGWNLPPREVFLSQTVATQAAWLSPGSAGVPPTVVSEPQSVLAEVGLSQDELDSVLAEL
jgi:amino acid adenylation domain-containing protein